VIHDILAPLLAEQARLEDELRHIPVFRRLEAIRTSIASLRAAYGEPAADKTPTNPMSQPVIAIRKRFAGGVTARVIGIAEAAMRSTGRRYRSPEILKMALQEGVSVKGAKPVAVISSILSHDELFDNAFDGRGQGYGLREWTQKVVPVHEENEPSSGSAVGPDAADEGLAPPNSALEHSNSPATGS